MSIVTPTGDARVEHARGGILIIALGLSFDHWPGRTSTIENEFEYNPVIGLNEINKKRKRVDETTKRNIAIHKAIETAFYYEELGKAYQNMQEEQEDNTKQEYLTRKRKWKVQQKEFEEANEK